MEKSNNINEVDFLLIEPLFWHISHYTTDQIKLAEILHAANYSVAIVDYRKDLEIPLSKCYKVINIDVPAISRKSPVRIPTLKYLIFDWRYYKNASAIIKQIKIPFKNIYLGTGNIFTLSFFRNNFLKGKGIFIWGNRARYFRYKPFRRDVYKMFKLAVLKLLIKKSKACFVISNPFIEKEFLNLGFRKEQLLCRQERFISKIEIEKKDIKVFNLLAIGLFRKGKSIRFALKPVRELDVKFNIAGISPDAFCEEDDRLIEEMDNSKINRVNKFLSTEEFETFLTNASFLIISNRPEKSICSSGTIVEAIIHSTPVIAPDFDPFRSYINQYKIGFLYEPGDSDSFKKALEKAISSKHEDFLPGITAFQKDILFDNVVKNVKEQLEINFKFIADKKKLRSEKGE